jgi:FkbM family methyltransferase
MKKLFIHILRFIYELIPGKIYLFRILRIFYRPSDFMLNQLYFSGKFRVSYGSYNFIMECHNLRGFTIENRLFWYKSIQNTKWETQSNRLWAQMAERSEIIFDVGANTGYYSLLAKAVNPTCKVYGFEPVPRIFKWYKNNCLVNKFDIDCFNIALSDRIGENKIFLQKSRQNVYSASLDKSFAESHSTRIIEPETIFTTTIKDIVEKNQLEKIDLMKIDVEGYELQVLTGMGEYLQKFKPSFLIEVLSNELGASLTEILKPLNYLFFNLNETQKPTLCSSITISQDHNFFICSEDIAYSLNLL